MDSRHTEKRPLRMAGTDNAERGIVKKDDAPTAVALPTVPVGRHPKKEYERIRTSPDRILMILLLTLVCLGSIIVFSASYPYAISKYGDSYYYVKRQAIFVGLGLCAMTVAMRVPYILYKKLSVPAYLVSALLLVLVLFIGQSEGEAKRWIGIPGTPFTMQPSELMKIALIMTLAWYVDKYAEYIQKDAALKLRFKYGVVFPNLLIFAACGLVLLEKHLSGTIIMFAIGLIVIFIGGANVWMTALVDGVVGIAGVLAFLAANPYALQRILTFSDENADALAEDWQTTQGLLAIGSGGVFGLGLGQSRQKYGYVSQPQNDFVFTIWCEEMGYVGAVVVILIFAALLWRGFTVARRAPDIYTSLVVYGIMSHISLQAILNMLVVTDTIPNTGISLPFFSYGGSSLIVLLGEMGIVLSISRHSRQRKL